MYLPFCLSGPQLLSMTTFRSTCVLRMACSFFFVPRDHAFVHVHRTLIITSASGRLGGSCVRCVNSAAYEHCGSVHLFEIRVFSGFMPQKWDHWITWCHYFQFLREPFTVRHSGCTRYIPTNSAGRVPLSAHPLSIYRL